MGSISGCRRERNTLSSGFRPDQVWIGILTLSSEPRCPPILVYPTFFPIRFFCRRQTIIMGNYNKKKRGKQYIRHPRTKKTFPFATKHAQRGCYCSHDCARTVPPFVLSASMWNQAGASKQPYFYFIFYFPVNLSNRAAAQGDPIWMLRTRKDAQSYSLTLAPFPFPSSLSLFKCLFDVSNPPPPLVLSLSIKLVGERPGLVTGFAVGGAEPDR